MNGLFIDLTKNKHENKETDSFHFLQSSSYVGNRPVTDSLRDNVLFEALIALYCVLVVTLKVYEIESKLRH